jgi:hypothetical protein
MSLAVNKIIIGAALSLSVAFVGSNAFALGAAAAVNTEPSLDTAAAPGTEAPSIPGPISEIDSDWMSHENRALMPNSGAWSLPTERQVRAEEKACLEENQLVHQLVVARSEGRDTDPAARNQVLGSISLAEGDRAMAENYFHKAEVDLRTDKTTTHNIDAIGLGDDPDAATMHPNTDMAAYY